MHRDTLSKALRTSGLRNKHVPHGFRASFRTLAREELDIDIDVLAAQLAHSVGDATQRAYNRARHFTRRPEASPLWADSSSEERRGGQGGGKTGRYRGWP